MIVARGLTKRYGRTVAVGDLTFTVQPGVVTGFLGPNGAGKSTTMRMLIGLDRPDAGQATVNGKPYRELRRPLREVGTMLEARSFHPGRSARAHLDSLAVSNAIPGSRVDEVLGLVGLETVGIAGKLVLSAGAVEKNIATIFSKLSLEPEAADNRRVLAVLRYLNA